MKFWGNGVTTALLWGQVYGLNQQSESHTSLANRETQTAIQKLNLKAKIQNQLAGLENGWPVPFAENSSTAPSVTVRLDPPDDPLPQVSAEIVLLDRARVRMEEGLMAKLEDEINIQLDESQIRIPQTVQEALSPFDDPEILRKSVQMAIKTAIAAPPLASTVGAYVPRTLYNRFRQVTTEKKSHNGPISTSFLESKSSSFGNVPILGSGPPPSLKVQLTELYQPDPSIKDKLEEVEQVRADEEAQMFEQAIAEMSQLTTIAIIEIEKQLEILMNPFLVPPDIVIEAASEILGQEPPPGTFRFNQTDPYSQRFIEQKCDQLKERHGDFHFDCPTLKDEKKNSEKKISKNTQTSFLETKESPIDSILGGPQGHKQLNVRVAQSDRPYPTVDEYAATMERKRDATERLERIKILALEMKLMKAQDEMLRETLHSAIARIISQMGEASSTIKEHSVAHNLPYGSEGTMA